VPDQIYCNEAHFSFAKELWRTIRTSKGRDYVLCQYGTGRCKGGGKGKDPATRQLGIGEVLGGVPPVTQGRPPAAR
jgi:hypothetical protein